MIKWSIKTIPALSYTNQTHQSIQLLNIHVYFNVIVCYNWRTYSLLKLTPLDFYLPLHTILNHLIYFLRLNQHIYACICWNITENCHDLYICQNKWNKIKLFERGYIWYIVDWVFFFFFVGSFFIFFYFFTRVTVGPLLDRPFLYFYGVSLVSWYSMLMVNEIYADPLLGVFFISDFFFCFVE